MPDENSATLSLNADLKNPPKKIIVHMPWFYSLDSAEADGGKLNGSGNSLSIPVSVKAVSIRWHRTATPSGLSFEETVAAYKDEYRKRHDELLMNGTSI